MTQPHEHNRKAWDARAVQGARFARPAQDDEFTDPLKKLDGRGWLEGDLHGRKMLCLASGGGRQSVLYAAAGADVTVVDISPAMLVLDREAAAARGLNVRTVEASMDDLHVLEAASFDVVIQPVSTCYVPDVRPVYREVARVLQPGGIYISQHKQPTSLQADVRPGVGGGYELLEPYYRRGPLPQVRGSLHREEGTQEYLHRWEELIGELCLAGFSIEGLTEPYHGGDSPPSPGDFSHRSRYLPPYVRLKARRHGALPSTLNRPKLWLGPTKF